MYGVGLAEDRALPWDAFVRTLPVGAGPRIAGRVATRTLMSAIGLAPVVLLAAVATEATTTPPRAAGVALALVAAGAPFVFGGLAIGYRLTVKAALPVAQVLLFPLAFAGGLFLPPSIFPPWLDTLSQILPSRAGRDLVAWAATGELGVLAAWSLAAAALAVWAYRRDEGSASAEASRDGARFTGARRRRSEELRGPQPSYD